LPGTPEQRAREQIETQLTAAGWLIQDSYHINLTAGTGIAIREFQLGRGFGAADYLLYANRKAIGVIEAKKEGDTLTGVEVQTEKYSAGLPASLPAWQRPLAFLYQPTGVETRFTNSLDPDPRSRPVFAFHQPQTLVAWAQGLSGVATAASGSMDARLPYGRPSMLLQRLRNLPALEAFSLIDADLSENAADAAAL